MHLQPWQHMGIIWKQKCSIELGWAVSTFGHYISLVQAAVMVQTSCGIWKHRGNYKPSDTIGAPLDGMLWSLGEKEFHIRMPKGIQLWNVTFWIRLQ